MESLKPLLREKSEVIALKKIHHIEFYVGNARQASHFYCSMLGFRLAAWCGLETGATDRSSYVVTQGDMRLVFTASLSGDHPIADHFRLHGDGAKEIAFEVDSVEQVFNLAVERGAQPIMSPIRFVDDFGFVSKASVAVYGDTIHSFIERNDYGGAFLPGYSEIIQPPTTEPNLLSSFDHLAICVEPLQLRYWVNFYQRVFDFEKVHEEHTSTEYSGMHSAVLQDKRGAIKIVLMTPAAGKRVSQIQEFLRSYRGPGLQHLAFLTPDILHTLKTIKARGLNFLQVSDGYYKARESFITNAGQDLAQLRDLNIMLDSDEWGYLMQSFSKVLQDRPTFFVEVIQRVNARGFGNANIKALFEALENEQRIRNGS